MSDKVLNALHRKLAAYEGTGETDLAKRVKARIAKLEKVPESKPATVPAPKKPTAKKAAKTTKKR